jgi:hypothetical protein
MGNEREPPLPRRMIPRTVSALIFHWWQVHRHLQVPVRVTGGVSLTDIVSRGILQLDPYS